MLATAAVQDRFADVFGNKRGSDRPDDENDKYIRSLVIESALAASLAKSSRRKLLVFAPVFVLIMVVFCFLLATEIYYVVSALAAVAR